MHFTRNRTLVHLWRILGATAAITLGVAVLKACAIAIYVLHRATAAQLQHAPLPGLNAVWVGAVDLGFLIWNALLLVVVLLPGLPFAIQPVAVAQARVKGRWNEYLALLYLSLLGGAVATVLLAVILAATFHTVPPYVGLLMFAAPLPAVVRIIARHGVALDTGIFAAQALMAGVTYAYVVVQTALIASTASGAQSLSHFAPLSAFGLMVLCTAAMAELALAHREWKPALALGCAAIAGLALLNVGLYFALPFRFTGV